MGLTVREQETTVNLYRDSDMCSVYTSDTTMMTKLDKFVESEDAPLWTLKEVHRLSSGEVVGKTYETHKKLISFRKNVFKRDMTDEQRKEAAERMRNRRRKSDAGHNAGDVTDIKE